MKGPLRRRIAYYTKLSCRYWADADTPRDFMTLMRVRLAQSKLGPYVCPDPVVARVNLESLGRDVYVRSHTTDISVLSELIVGRGYEAVCRYLSADPLTIVDLGANTGLTSRWFLQRFPRAALVAVEPEPGNAAVLNENLADFADSATVIEACVGSREGRVRLHTAAGEHGYTMMGDAEPAEPAIDVDVVSMEHVLDRAGMDHVDLLKCDIEGAEQELFSSSRSWISRVDVVVVECHGSFDVFKLQRMLSENGAHFEILHRDPNPEFACEVGILRRTEPAQDQISSAAG